MIGKVRGVISEIYSNTVLLETVSGVFYEVLVPPALLIKPVGTPLEIYTHHHVREDIQLLFGFETKKDKQLFQMLISVSGVGPKTAFQILSYASSDEVINAIKGNDVNTFVKVPGLGKKTALKIMLELAQKLDSEFEMKQIYVSEEDKMVVDALVSLGYKASDVQKIFQQLPKDMSLENKIKEGIRLASSQK